ncbi:MAG: AlpA family transcriptional regulator [Saccharospirillum sp.]
MRILRIKDVMSRTGLARSTIYKHIDLGTFPKPVSLGGRAVGWVESEIDGWIETLISARGQFQSTTAESTRLEP